MHPRNETDVGVCEVFGFLKDVNLAGKGQIAEVRRFHVRFEVSGAGGRADPMGWFWPFADQGFVDIAAVSILCALDIGPVFDCGEVGDVITIDQLAVSWPFRAATEGY